MQQTKLCQPERLIEAKVGQTNLLENQFARGFRYVFAPNIGAITPITQGPIQESLARWQFIARA